jgi:DNA (cytosine-5)-methyltransferase 1
VFPFDIVFANDFNEDACKTYSNNIDKHIFCGDVSKIANDDIPKNVDILIGGFPCQGFSIANKNELPTPLHPGLHPYQRNRSLYRL